MAFNHSLPSRRIRAKTGQREEGRKSVFFVVYRKEGQREDTLALNRQLRRFMDRINPVLVETSECVWEQYRWADTYRMAIPHGKTVQDVTCLLREAGIHSGPYWTLGSVQHAAVGSGIDCLATKRKAIARERGKADDKNSPFLTMVRQVMGLEFNCQLLLTEETLPPSDWNRSGADWVRLEKRFPLFPALFNAAMKAWEQDPAGMVLQIVKLEKWIDSSITLDRPEEPKSSVVAGAAAQVSRMAWEQVQSYHLHKDNSLDEWKWKVNQYNESWITYGKSL